MKGAFEALAKAAASFCGDSSALATTLSKRASRGVTSAILVFEATLSAATGVRGRLQPRRLAVMGEAGGGVPAAGVTLAEQGGL